jgi:YHS domain-containing protein
VQGDQSGTSVSHSGSRFLATVHICERTGPGHWRTEAAASNDDHRSQEITMLKTILSGLAFLFFLAGAALAGPQYIDGTGHAVSGYDVVSYFDLKQSTVGQPQASPLPGKATITTDYNGAKFAFNTEENKARFLASPTAFVPQYNGHCAFGVSKGGKVPGNPKLWRVVNGKLYLNITQAVVDQWEENISGNIKIAQSNWKSLVKKPASTRVIPGFSSKAPVK